MVAKGTSAHIRKFYWTTIWNFFVVRQDLFLGDPISQGDELVFRRGDWLLKVPKSEVTVKTLPAEEARSLINCD